MVKSLLVARNAALLLILILLISTTNNITLAFAPGSYSRSSRGIDVYGIGHSSTTRPFIEVSSRHPAKCSQNSGIFLSTPSLGIHDKRNTRLLLAQAAMASSETPKDDDNIDELPATVTPILLTVLALIVSEGIALSTLPLHLRQTLGATPVQVGMATSAFSVAQMTMCPLLVALSNKRGERRSTLSVCLAGAALSSTVLALGNSVGWLIVARFVAGMFAAAIPVAQAGVMDLVHTPEQQTLALSRVSAASQTGLVVGPMVSAVVQILLKRCLGVTSQDTLVRCVFGASALFALSVLGIIIQTSTASTETTALTEAAKSDGRSKVESNNAKEPEVETIQSASVSPVSSTNRARLRLPKIKLSPQPLLRIIALAAGWSLTLTVAIYSLLASQFLGYGQSQLSATYSAGAMTVIATQLWVVPRLAKRVGNHMSCTLGLCALAVGLAGCSWIRWPLGLHVMLYLLIRMGQGVTDTSTATLVAQASNNQNERAYNLGMIQSTRAGARILTPLLSGSLFTRSCQPSFPTPGGALPYLVNAVLALALTPLPLVLKRMEQKATQNKQETYASY